MVEEKKEKALEELRKLVRSIGYDFGKNMIKQLGTRSIVPINPNDPAEGNRFSSLVYDNSGKLSKGF